jgi:hypothetical protein
MVQSLENSLGKIFGSSPEMALILPYGVGA